MHKITRTFTLLFALTLFSGCSLLNKGGGRMKVLDYWFSAPPGAMDVYGDLAYIGGGAELARVRFGKSAEVQKRVCEMGRVNCIKVMHGKVYVGFGKAGFRIYDLNLNLLQQFPEWTNISKIGANENLLLLADGDLGLKAYDLETLEYLTTIDAQGGIGDLEFDGNWVSYSFGLARKAGEPVRGEFHVAKIGGRGEVRFRTKYACPAGEFKYRFLESRKLYAIRQLSEKSIKPASEMALGDGPGQFVVDLYILGEEAPGEPRQTFGPFEGVPARFIVENGLAYLTTNDSLLVYSLEDPMKSWSKRYTNGTGPLASNGRKIFVGSRGENPKGVRTVELLDNGEIKDTANYQVAAEVEGVFIDGDYCYVAAGRDGFRVFDISDPKKMRHVAWLESPFLSEDLWVQDGACYVADGHGISFYDVTDPENPKLTEYIENDQKRMDHWVEGVRRVGDYLYVCSHRRFRVYDVSDIRKAKPLSEIIVRTSKDCAVRDGLAHLAENEGYSIVDVSDPMNMKIVSAIDLPGKNGKGFDVEVKDNYAYVAVERCGVYVVDFSDIEKPVVVQEIHTDANNFQGVRIDGDYLYVGTVYDQGVIKYDISDPLNPVRICNLDTPGAALNMHIRDGIMAIADYRTGVILTTP
jgi:hypothetical protein